MKPARPSWVKDKTLAEGFEVIKCLEYDDYKDFNMEPSGYYALIKILWDRAKISVAICNKNHEIVKELQGKRAQDIYFAIFKYEEENNVQWFTRKDHIAYLGKELKKAEISLA